VRETAQLRQRLSQGMFEVLGCGFAVVCQRPTRQVYSRTGIYGDC
jgi:hypothetical protein